jgi:hypothetical protein
VGLLVRLGIPKLLTRPGSSSVSPAIHTDTLLVSVISSAGYEERGGIGSRRERGHRHRAAYFAVTRSAISNGVDRLRQPT